MTPQQLDWLRSRTPQIPPAPPGARPFISVIVLTHNRPHLLATSLQSVVSQALGEDEMQILVLDDASAGAETSEVVQAVGGARVEHHRHPTNLGTWGNSNAGLGLARGQWIQILHDDDWVEPGFYEALQRDLPEPKSVGAALTRIRVHRDGDRTFDYPLQRPNAGRLADWRSKLAAWPHVQVPAVVVRREVYAELGGFVGRFTYPADIEMWLRIASCYDWWYVPGAVACYREHDGNMSAVGTRTAANIAQIRDVFEFAQGYLPHDERERLRSWAFQFWSTLALRRARAKLRVGEHQAAALLMAEALLTDPSPATIMELLNIRARAPRFQTNPGLMAAAPTASLVQAGGDDRQRAPALDDLRPPDPGPVVRL